MKDDEIAIVFGLHLNLGAVAGEEATIIADPKADRWVVLGAPVNMSGRSSAEIMAPPNNLGYNVESTTGH
jgi:hypothetical protein